MNGHAKLFTTNLLATVVCVATSLNAFCEDKTPAATQQKVELRRQVEVQLDYLSYLPQRYKDHERWPLLIFLHGAGERGADLELVKTHGPPKLIESGEHFPFIVISPQCPENRWWESTELVALLDEVIEKYHVDEDRVYVTGLSMGGFGSWSLAHFIPGRLAAIAPICGGGEVHWTEQFAHLPIWAFHGAKDEVVPLVRSQSMVEALKKEDGDPKLTIYPDATHDSWTETYANPQLYKWLLEQKRK